MSLRQIEKNYKLYFLAIGLKATCHKTLRPIFTPRGEIGRLKNTPKKSDDLFIILNDEGNYKIPFLKKKKKNIL